MDQSPTIKDFIFYAINENLQQISSIDLLKRGFAKKYKTPFWRNPEIKKIYDRLVADGLIHPNREFERLLITKRIRTLSGVAVVAVLTKPYPCPGECLYCPNEKAMPKSYLSNEPAVMRAIKTQFDPYRQVQARLRALELNGHTIDKVELIVMGGTFSYLPAKYQYQFIVECFRACNDYPNKKNRTGGKTLAELRILLSKEQRRNEKARCRMVGLTLETRPDYINREEIIRFRELGATRVELGVQHINDQILRINKRGHLANETVKATKLLKDAGFKINYHLMPGLPGSSPGDDLRMFKKIFSHPDFQPDMIKIYPCVVTRDAELYELWKKKKYKPLSNRSAAGLISRIKSAVPPYVRITRLIRDIPEESIIAGPNITNLRQLLQNKGVECRCIRCREVRSVYDDKESIALDRIDYPAAGGQEIFLQFISSDRSKLYALLRLRIPDGSKDAIFNCLNRAAIIREVHTYGKLVPLRNRESRSPQHSGLGKKLIQEAERIAWEEFGLKRIAVISGIGVRGYYRKLGFRQKDTYMEKDI